MNELPAWAVPAIATGVTSAVVMLVGWSLTRNIKHLDRAIEDLSNKTQIALERTAQHDTKHAVTEARLGHQDSRIARVETDVSHLHNRVSRLVTDKFFRDPNDKEGD